MGVSGGGELAAGGVEAATGRGGMLLPSDRCAWDELCLPDWSDCLERAALVTGQGWTRRWTATWKYGASRQPVVCPVRDLASMPLPGAQPVRRFSWRTGQRHRPGLQFMVSTGLHCGFESMEEAQLLLALDFAGAVTAVLSQPFRLRFTAAAGVGEHIPDFLVRTSSGFWLVDVRPAALIRKAEDRVCFAAAFEVALAAGWRYVLVTGWRPNVQTTLDMLSSQRREMSDPLMIANGLIGAAARGPLPFGDLANASALPAVARAHALHLVWHRRLAIDLAEPLTDESTVVSAGRPEPGGRP